MSKEFDPYYKWLGISPDEQPPTLYRLLGVQRYQLRGTGQVSAAPKSSGGSS